jgi:hypothetical protein
MTFSGRGFSRRITYLATSVALGAAIAVSGFIVGIANSDTEAAASGPDVTQPVTVATIAMGPAASARRESARLSQQFPAELLIAPQSVTAMVAPPRTAPEAIAPPKPEETGSIAAPLAAPVPLPRRRAPQETRADQPPKAETPGAQVARIKTALRLTREQERYWPPVEAALRDIVAQMPHDTGRRAASPPPVDQGRVERLTSAAMPLIMTFDEAQKREVRRIARNMGLENVASAI